VPWPDDEHAGARAAEPSAVPGAGSWVFATIVLVAVVVVDVALLSLPFGRLLRLPEPLGQAVLGLVFGGVPVATLLAGLGMLVDGPARRLVHLGVVLVCVPLSIGASLSLGLGLSFGPGGFVGAVLMFGIVLAFVLALARRALRRPAPHYSSNDFAARDRRLTRLVVWGWVVVALVSSVLSTGPFFLLTGLVAGDPYSFPRILLLPVVLAVVVLLVVVRRRDLRRHAVPETDALPSSDATLGSGA
jgi:hypothetical protein